MLPAQQLAVETPLGAIPVRMFGEHGPALILTHGFFVDGRLWDRVIPLLADRFRVVVPDLPLGAHRTPVPDRTLLSPVAVSDALTAVIRSVPGPPRPRRLRYRWSDLPARPGSRPPPGRRPRPRLLRRFRTLPAADDQALVWAARLLGGARSTFALFGSPALQRMPLPLAWVAKRKFDAELVRAWATPARTNSAIRADAKAMIVRISGKELRVATESLRGWDHPALVFWAENEIVFPKKDAHRLLALFPKGRLEWVADSRTFTCVDQPERTARTADLVLRRGAPRPTR